MNYQVLHLLQQMFPETEHRIALALLEQITLEHVMAESQHNLDNTHTAVLLLSQGNMNALKENVKAAKQDFRDVIYWASQRLSDDELEPGQG